MEQHNLKNPLPILEYDLTAFDDNRILIRTSIGMLIIFKAPTLKDYVDSLNTLRQDCHIGLYINQMIEQSEEKFKESKHICLVKKLTSYRQIKTNKCEKIINYSVTGLPPVIRFTIP